MKQTPLAERCSAEAPSQPSGGLLTRLWRNEFKKTDFMLRRGYFVDYRDMRAAELHRVGEVSPDAYLAILCVSNSRSPAPVSALDPV